jgi:hypothetical protein
VALALAGFRGRQDCYSTGDRGDRSATR